MAGVILESESDDLIQGKDDEAPSHAQPNGHSHHSHNKLRLGRSFDLWITYGILRQRQVGGLRLRP